MEVIGVIAVIGFFFHELLKIFYKFFVTFCFEVVIFKTEFMKGITYNPITL